MIRGRLALLLAATLCAGCTSTSELASFTSDGCSLFPDRDLFSGSDDWCDCCYRHDLAYWRGGSPEERAHADAQLGECVRIATGDTALARTMASGVRVGGHWLIPTWFRWGYGWPYGQGIKLLSQEQQEKVGQRMSEIPADYQSRVCPK